MKLFTISITFEITDMGIIIGGVNPELDPLSHGEIKSRIGESVLIMDSEGNNHVFSVVSSQISNSMIDKKNIGICVGFPKNTAPLQNGSAVYSISKETLMVLRNAGWSEGRSLDIKETEENLEQLGYVVFPEVKKFLQEFGNLVIEDTINDEIHDTSIRFTNYYRYRSFKSEENYAGEKLVPVGTIDSGNLVLLVSESGKVYCSTGKLGDHAFEAWECLICGGVKGWGSF